MRLARMFRPVHLSRFLPPLLRFILRLNRHLLQFLHIRLLCILCVQDALPGVFRRLRHVDERSIIDIFRMADGMVQEHWEVVQEIPAELPHDNGIF